MEQELMQQQYEELYNVVVRGLASGYTALYHIDLDTEKYVNFLISDRISDTKANFARFDKFTDLFNAFVESPAVHPEDKSLFAQMRDVNLARDLMKDKKRHTVMFRRNYGGEYRWTEMMVVKHEEADQPAHSVTVGYIDRDEEIRQEQQVRHALEEANDMRRLVGNFAKNYKIAYMVNLADDTYFDINNPRAEKSKLTFSENAERITSSQIYPQDQDKMRRELDFDVIREKISETGTYIVEYRSVSDGIPRWSEMTVTTMGKDQVAIGFATKDEEILTRHISDSILKTFDGIYVADLSNNRMKILKGTGGFKQYEGKIIPQRETMAFFASNLTGEDKVFFRDVYGNPEATKDMLAKDSDIEYIYRSPNYGGGFVWMKSEVHTLTWDENGRPETAMVGISKVDSQQKERMRLSALIAEQKEQLEIQQEQLKEALAMAQSSSRAKTTFLNNMSHDIRTPMNAIIGFTGLAASHIDNKGKVQDYLSKITQSSEHLLSLINDVLDMSRIESGKMNLNEKDENLPDIIHTLRDIVHADIQSKRIDFFIDTVAVPAENIVCDKLRLNQVLLNVLSNAIKYTPAGGTVSMRIAEKSVSDSGRASYEFRIKDNGMGMTEEFVKTIYDPFTRVKSSTISGIQGTGLGMAITKNIIDMMGGTIDITSAPAKGTEVVMNLEFTLSGGPTIPDEIPELQGLRGLVVDDDSNSCLSVSEMLREVGMRAEWCTSGKEAVIRASEAFRMGDLFKVYIIDWIMPDMNGVETVRRIRKVIGDDTPIIILSAYDWADIEDEAREAGVTAFVRKPMFQSDLHRVLYSCLGRTAEPAAPVTEDVSLQGKKILLVEDNELNREIATVFLEEFGCSVTPAEDGDIAVEKVASASEGDYDLVLMDIQMPTIDGYEATRRIRALGTPISRIPILAMTANAFEEDRKLAFDAGMNEHIVKPIDADRLKETLKMFLC